MACAKTNKTNTDSVLDNSQQKTLKLAMDEIIPANDKMPSASVVGGVTYILEIIVELPDLLPLFEGLIAQLDELSDYNFPKINKEERIAILRN